MVRRGFSKDIWGTGLNSNKTSLRGCFISCFAYVEHILFQTSPPHMTCPIWVLEHHKRSTSWSTEDFLNLFCPNQLKRFQIWQGGHVKIKFTTSLIFLGFVPQWPESLFCWVWGEFALHWIFVGVPCTSEQAKWQWKTHWSYRNSRCAIAWF